MKHLRRFNESLDVSEDDYLELKDFCETNLAFLLDDYSYELLVRKRTYGDPPKSDVVVAINPARVDKLNGLYTAIANGSLTIGGKESIQWDAVSDYVIPFLTLLDRRYVLDLQGHGGTLRKPDQNIQIKIKGKETGYYTIEDIIEEKVSLEGELFQIATCVKSKK